MAYGSLPSTTLTIPFAAGLNTKGDKRAKQPPMLDIATNVEFDDIGGLRTRYPFTAGSFTLNIAGGGTLSNVRRVFDNAGELLCFTDTALYSWSPRAAKWVLKGTHLAAKTDEQTVFATNGDQVTPDRAELANVIVNAWAESGKVYVAASDKTTGAVIQASIAVTSGASSRPRTLALSTRILLFWSDDASGDLRALSIDTNNVASSIASGIATPTTVVSAATGFNLYYDVARIGTTDFCELVARLNPTTSYHIVNVGPGLGMSSVTKARTCDGPIAVSVAPDGQIQVVRANGTNIQGDLLSAAHTDVYTGQAIGTSITNGLGLTDTYQIAAAHRTVQNGGQYRCYVWWGVDEEGTSAGAGQATKYNWVDTGNTLGTQALFQPWMSVASRAFDYGGSVYYWGIFNASALPATGGRLQGTYILFRDDGRVVAKAASGNATWVAVKSCLSGVQLTDGTTTFKWASTFSRRVSATYDPGFRARAPRDIAITFDSDEARRCARLGSTLYIAGGEVLQYDGRALAELGFYVGAYRFDFFNTAVGALPAGTYAYKATLRSMNGVGEVDRSTSFGFGNVGVGANSKPQFHFNAIWPTHKTNTTMEMWRTTVNPSSDSPYYLVSGADPADTTNPNRYIANDLTAYLTADLDDNMLDAVASANEANPENGSVLESIAPPPASIVVASDTRLFLAGVAGDPDRVWYSKQRNDGEVASFNDALTVQIPPAGGRITALAILQETLVVFRERAIYLLPGDGFDNAGGGSNYGPARVAASDYGAVNQESVALVPDGLLFKSSKGWCMLTRSWSVDEKVGLPIAAYNSETPLAVDVMPAQHQVRVLTASRMLVWDYLVNQWGEWTISGGLDSTIWSNTHVYLASGAIKQQQSTYTGVDYGYDVESVWIKINELQGRGIVRAIEILGEARAASSMRVRLARNYESDGAGGWSYNYDKTWGVTPMVVGGPLQLKVAPTIKRPIQAIKVRLTALGPDKVSAPTTETAKLTGLSIAAAIEDGLYSGLPAAQKQ